MDALFGTSTGKVSATKPSTQLRIQSSVIGLPVPIVYGKVRIAGNLLDYQDFLATQHKSSGGGGKGGGFTGSSGKGGNTGVTYSYSAAVVIGLCEGPIASFGTVWNNKTKVTTADVNFTGFLGGYAQSAWSYMSSHHSGNAINYRGTTYAAAGVMELGNTPELANFNFEVKSTWNGAISGLDDADPKDVVIDLLTNQYYGAGYPSANLGSLSIYSSYCRATGMVISPALTSQQVTADVLKQIAEGTNSEFRWTGSVLDIVPYGDTSITAHGSTYTAPGAPQYDISDGDFLPNPGERPVQFTRARPSEQYNITHVRYLDRSNDYNQVTVDGYDEAAVALYGRREEPPRDYSFFCDGAAAQLSAALRVGRQSVRVKYRFKVGRRFVRLDAMDIVSLTHAKLGLAAQWVRITEIQELDDGRFDITAEEYLNGTGNAPIYSRQANTGYGANYNVASSSINTPIIFNPPQALVNGNTEIWIGVSGSNQDTWGGCQVWVSTDDVTYRQVGTIVGSARQGVVYSATYPAGNNLDTTNVCFVDLTMSRGALAAGTTTDRDKFNTLCYVGGELISYDNAPLQATYKYGLGSGGNTRRGAYGSQITAHTVGTPFLRLDEQIFKLDFTKDHLDTVTYFKFTSFNRWGGAQETLAGVSSYSITLKLPPRPMFEHIKSAVLDDPAFLGACLEAGDGLSFTFGVSAHWYDRSANNFYWNNGDGAGFHTMTFSGTSGDVNSGNWTVGGGLTGMASLDPGVTQWYQQFHKPGGAFSFFGVVRLSSFNYISTIFSSIDAGGTVGVEFGYRWAGGGPGRIYLDIGGNAGGASMVFLAGNNQYLALGCSYDDLTGTTIFLINGTLYTFAFGGSNTNAANSTQNFTSGKYTRGAPNFMLPGDERRILCAWSKALSGASLHDLYKRWLNDRPGYQSVMG